MIDYNILYDMAREQFYDPLGTKESFGAWAQKHTAMNHILGGLMVRKPINETHDGEIEFHDECTLLFANGDSWESSLLLFENLVSVPLDAREGYAESA